jgi:hypothetical protein
MFCDITWGAGGSTADLTLDIASKMQNTVRKTQLVGDRSCPSFWGALTPQVPRRCAWRR